MVGTAVTAAIPDYPNVCFGSGCFLAGNVSNYNPGLVWANRSRCRAHCGNRWTVAYYLNLMLKSPGEANAFANRYDADASPTAPLLLSWQNIVMACQVLAKVHWSSLREAGCLPCWHWPVWRCSSAVAWPEHLLGGPAEGGWRYAVARCRRPAFRARARRPMRRRSRASVRTVGGAVDRRAGSGCFSALRAPPSLSAATVALVVAVALAVAIVATFVPAIRATRQSTVSALDDSARPPRRSAAMIRLSAHLPATLLLGVRIAVRRPRRLLLSVFSVAVTTSGLVAVLILHTASATWSLGPQVAQATTIISVMLIVLAAVNAIFIAWTTALEARHPAALVRALGATPEQITTGLSVAFLPPALLGALLGIPGGIGIFDAAKSGGGTATLPSVLLLLAMARPTLLVIAVLTAIPTRIGARQPVAEVL